MVEAASPQGTSTRAADRLRPLLAPGTPWHIHPDGYLDLLDEQPREAATTRSQSLWLSRRGPQIYLRLVQPLVRSLGAPPGADRLAAGMRLTEGATVLDVGCGPGVITAGLASAVGPDGFAVGLDVSAPMLSRAVALAPPTMALVRGDAMRLPFLDATFDAVCSTAVLMLVADPVVSLAEMLRVLRPGGWLAVVVACRGSGLAGRLGAQVGRVAGGRMFGADEIAMMVDTMAVDRVRGHANDMISTTYARRATG